MRCLNSLSIGSRRGLSLGLLGLLGLCGAAGALRAAEHIVSSKEDIRSLTEAGTIKPGDVVIWRVGEYEDQNINFNISGTAEARITLRAETPGGVTFKGKSFIKYGGDYLTVDGFRFFNGDD